MNELQELLTKSEGLLYHLEKDKDVKEQNWWLDQRAQLAEAIDNAKKIYDEEASLIAEVKRLKRQRNLLVNCLKYSNFPKMAAREILDELDAESEESYG